MIEVVFIFEIENFERIRMPVHTIPRIGEKVYFAAESHQYKVADILHVLNPTYSPLHEIEIYLDPIIKTEETDDTR